MKESTYRQRAFATNKFSFHIPQVAYVNGEYIAVPYEEFENALGEKLIELGIDAWYVIASTGVYKGRRYPQNIMVVYCDEDKKDSVANVFKNVCKRMSRAMQQEKFAYELNDTMYIF